MYQHTYRCNLFFLQPKRVTVCYWKVKQGGFDALDKYPCWIDHTSDGGFYSLPCYEYPNMIKVNISSVLLSKPPSSFPIFLFPCFPVSLSSCFLFSSLFILSLYFPPSLFSFSLLSLSYSVTFLILLFLSYPLPHCPISPFPLPLPLVFPLFFSFLLFLPLFFSSFPLLLPISPSYLIFPFPSFKSNLSISLHFRFPSFALLLPPNYN